MGRALGPTQLMSPRAMFRSWGISSRLVARSSRPILVMRGSSSWAWMLPNLSTALGTMVRNLNTWTFPLSLPHLSWVNRIGPLSSSLMAMLKTNHMGEAINRPTAATRMSKGHLSR